MTDQPESPTPPSADAPRKGATFAVDRVVGTTVKTFFANLVPIVSVAALLESPVIASNVIWRPINVPGSPPSISPMYFVALLLSFIAYYLITGTLTLGVYRLLRHQPFTWGQCLTQGLRRFPTMFGASILVGLATGLGIVLCIVPGMYVATVYAVAVPAVVVEGQGVFAALARSKALTRGHGWPVFGALVLVGIVASIPSVIAALALAENPVLATAVTSTWQVFAVAFQSVLSSVIYYQLREAREDLDAPELAAAFD